MYQKCEIEKYTVYGNLILPKKMERHFLNFLAQLACEFAWIGEYLQASCIQHLRYALKNLTESSFTQVL